MRIYEFPCEECGKMFTAKRRDKRFCSTSCMEKDRYRRTIGRTLALKRENVPCQHCGEPFTPKRIDARYCSVQCGKRAYAESRREEIREVKRRWREANPEKVQEIKERFKERHPGNGKERYSRLKADPERLAKNQEYHRQHYQANREEYLERARRRSMAQPTVHYQYRHGRDWDELFNEFWELQGGLCYLCGDPLERTKFRGVHLDHDHSCCKLGYSCEKCRRGLSCPDCNILIGRAKDDPDRLRRIADNLEKASELVRQRIEAA